MSGAEDVNTGAAWGAIELDLPRGYRWRPTGPAPRDETHPPRSDRASPAGWGSGPGGRAQRLRAASGARQAIVKVIGFRNGRGEAGRTLSYVARRERVHIETSFGEILSTREDLRSLLDDWSAGFSGRADGRDVMHLVLSFPEDVSPGVAGAIARATLPEIAEGRDWAFVVHDDTRHAHAHALVRLRGADGRHLRTGPDKLQRWSEATARHARERGVMLEASPRRARGRGEKGERTWERAMRLRGEIPLRHIEAAREAIALLERNGHATTRYERLLAAAGRRERAAFGALSRELLAEAQKADGPERERLLRLAEAAARHGNALPEARTRRQAMAAIAEEMRARGEPVDPESVARAFARERDNADRAREVAEGSTRDDARRRPPSREASPEPRTPEPRTPEPRTVEPHTPERHSPQTRLSPPRAPADDAERAIARRHGEWLAAREARRDRDPGRDPD